MNDIATQAAEGNLNGVLISIAGVLLLGLLSIIWFMIKRYISSQEDVNKELSSTLKEVSAAVSEFKLIANEVQHAQKDIGRLEKDYKDHLNIFHTK